ncbi:hypothetical protein [Arthrobacter sp. EPSL27]|uniref:hypothetical protein n=1 Tax=Arthrobacter sp. EPSL27 TaxID=1745378 RepID=UPI000AE57C40|nr:hypothetical protein [Arthrobacter sp. EPSL27]
MDQSLNAQVRIDTVSDTVRIDVLGSLTQISRPSLMQTIRRVRQMGITSHIRVELGSAAFVESAALAGLRADLNAIDGGGVASAGAGAAAKGSGVSLMLSTGVLGPAAALQPLDLAGELQIPANASVLRPLTGYSDDELLAASDSVFGLLDDPSDMARSELLAAFDDIGLEITRREGSRDAHPIAAIRELDAKAISAEAEPV